MYIKSSAIKLLLFALILMPLILIVKTQEKKYKAKEAITDINALNRQKDTSIFFIGSSRVQYSLDPQIIQAYYSGFNTYNLGMSHSNFLGNCILADYIMQTVGHKILLIELSPLYEELPEGLFLLLSMAKINQTQKAIQLAGNYSSKHFNIILNNLNQKLSFSIFLNRGIKNIFFFNTEKTTAKLIGFNSVDKKTSYSTASFLKISDINVVISSFVNLSEYKKIIDYLNTSAKKLNTQIIFFLPLTYQKQVEKEIVIPLYHSLPPHMKLEYTDDFIQSLTNSQYLLDKIHFNSAGAKIYSQLMIPLLKKKFE